MSDTPKCPTCGGDRDAMIGCLNFFHANNRSLTTGAALSAERRPIFDNSPHAPGQVYALTDEHVDQIIYNSAGPVVNLAVEVRQLRAEVKRLMALNKERTDGINAANRRAYLADDRLAAQVAEAWDQQNAAWSAREREEAERAVRRQLAEALRESRGGTWNDGEAVNRELLAASNALDQETTR